MSPNRQRLGFTFKETDLSSIGGHTYCLSLRDGNKVRVRLFLILEYYVIGRYRHTHYEKDSKMYGLSKSAVN